MKIRKNVSVDKLAANKKNARKSPVQHRLGVKPRQDKRNHHGFFAREFVLNDKETRQLETIRRSLHSQLAPNAVMQGLKFGGNHVCIGRRRLGLRVDMCYVNRVLWSGWCTRGPTRPNSRGRERAPNGTFPVVRYCVKAFAFSIRKSKNSCATPEMRKIRIQPGFCQTNPICILSSLTYKIESANQ